MRFRLVHPLLYSTLAGLLAGAIEFVLAIAVLREPVGRSAKLGVVSGVTWLLVLLTLTIVVRWRRED